MEQFLTEPFTSYVEKMAQDGTYADHVCIQPLANMLQVKLHITHTEEPDLLIAPSEPGHYGLLRLGYLPDLHHYVSLAQRYKGEDFVDVRLSSKTRSTVHKMFIAKVLKFDSEVTLRFMKEVSPTVYTWPSQNDVFTNPHADIIQRLSPPSLLPVRGIKLKFIPHEIQQSRNNL